ncbi:DUF167 domain-containing protein [Nitrosophilus alvini]|uniref:DUF167 domain-containing protein n=1 Tax=Nitrosophilus alvini TaxID=2714855 RepID=UPI00190DDD0A|nr:DUF167 domain-containing protein [Nitrosophilus alvini]
MWYEIIGDEILFYIKAQPNSSRNEFAGIYDDSLKVKIKAPAVEGAANKELVKFLSKSFKIPKSSIEFLGGETSKRKKIKMQYNEKIKEFVKKMGS